MAQGLRSALAQRHPLRQLALSEEAPDGQLRAPDFLAAEKEAHHWLLHCAHAELGAPESALCGATCATEVKHLAMAQRSISRRDLDTFGLAFLFFARLESDVVFQLD